MTKLGLATTRLAQRPSDDVVADLVAKRLLFRHCCPVRFLFLLLAHGRTATCVVSLIT